MPRSLGSPDLMGLPLAVCVAAVLVAPTSAYAQDTTPPTITAPSPVTAECIVNTQQSQVSTGATAIDDISPLVTLRHWLGGVGGTAITNPHWYSIGSTAVTVEACDQATPTPNCATKLVAVVVQDTTPPIISVPDLAVKDCTASAGTPLDLSNDIIIGDVCDPLSVGYSLIGAPALYPIGLTTITVQATDGAGNVRQKPLDIWIKDSDPPVFDSPLPDFAVAPSGVDCDPDGTAGPLTATDGSMIALPQFSATEPTGKACSDPADLLYSFSVPGLGETTASQVCLQKGVTTTLTARVVDLAFNVNPVQFAVTVDTAPGLALFQNNVPAGFVNTAALVNISIVTPSGNTPYDWVVAGGGGGLAPKSESAGVYTETVTADGFYCPAHVSVTDAAAATGATTLCFGKDTTAPNIVTSSVPATGEYYFGDRLQLFFEVNDGSGVARSGIELVAVTLNPLSAPGDITTLYTATNTCSNTVAPGLDACPTAAVVAGCDDTQPAPYATFCQGGIVTLNIPEAPPEVYELTLTITDAAGNATANTYLLSVLGYADGLDRAVFYDQGDADPTNDIGVDALLADINTPLGALADLASAKTFLQRAQAFKDEHPGHSTTFARRAWLFLNQAQSAGADTSTERAILTGAIVSETRRFIEQTNAFATTNAWSDWRILGNNGATPPKVTGELYFARAFMHPAGTWPVATSGKRDYIIDVSAMVGAARVHTAAAEAAFKQGQQLAAIDEAIKGTDGIALLFDDQVLAGLFARPTHVAGDAAPESYFDGTVPADIGLHIAQSVSSQVARTNSAPLNAAIPAAAAAIMSSVATRIASFASAVGNVQQAYLNSGVFPNGFGNEEVTTNIYLQAQQALDELATIQGSSVYSYGWRAGMALTLGFVVNFSMYEGPTALTRDSSDPNPDGSASAWPGVAGDTMIIDDGSGTASSTGIDAQAAECRYNRLMYRLSNGDVAAATQLYANSKCLIIHLYNQLYAPGIFVPTDLTIDPTAYSCAATFGDVFDLDVECIDTSAAAPPGGPDLCNGINEDGDTEVDEDFVANEQVLCGGAAACGSTSQCVNGVIIPCVAPLAIAPTDVTCDGVDDDCDGTADDNWVQSSCGIGACANTNICTAGVASTCVPAANATPETCDGLDNNCNILVDEGLDSDADLYGCIAGTDPNVCRRCEDGFNDPACLTHPSDGNWTSLLCPNDAASTAADCDDFNPLAFPPPGYDPANPAATEICDSADNNCNGSVDEGVKTGCGDCNPLCFATVIGPGGDVPYTPGPGNSTSVITNPDGTLTLAQQSGGTTTPYAFISNTDDGTVSKIDTRTGQEAGRYCSALKNATDQAGQPRGDAGICAACDGCNTPSRTAVTLDGDVFVANRCKDGGLPVLTKVADDIADCVDFNNSGGIETSNDANGDGVIDPTDPLEYFGENDECILWSQRQDTWDPSVTPQAGVDLTALSSIGFIMRALAIDAEGDVWVGNYRDYGYWEVNPDNGLVKRWLYIGGAPYGAVIDSKGILWTSVKVGTARAVGCNIGSAVVTHGITSWNPEQCITVNIAASVGGTYGIAIDGKDRVWIGSSSKSSVLGRYDPSDQSWAAIPVTDPDGYGKTKGVTVSADGIAWAAQTEAAVSAGGKGGRITGYDVDTLQIAVVNSITQDYLIAPTAIKPVGVGVGWAGTIWAGNNGSDNVTVINPLSGAVGHYPAGKAPYTYSDFTGSILATFTAPRGSYGQTMIACPSGGSQLAMTAASQLIWTALTPGATEVKMRIRFGADLATLGSAQWNPVAGYYPMTWSGACISSVPSMPPTAACTNISGLGAGTKWIEAEAELKRDDATGQAPTLITFTVARTCPGS